MKIPRKSIVYLIILGLLFLGLGCSRTQPAPEPEPEPETPPVETPAEPESAEQDDEKDVIEAEGRYVGFADSRSVEIELTDGEDDFMVFQLDETVQQQLEIDEPEPGTEILVHYRKPEQGQPIIVRLERK